MGNCTIEIITVTEGDESVFRTNGTYVLEWNALTVFYRQDGDAVSLHLERDGLSMQRKGKTSLSANFSPGRKTSMRLELCGREADLPLETDVYSASFSEKDFTCTARLEYSFVSAAVVRKFQLDIKIFLSAEVQ